MSDQMQPYPAEPMGEPFLPGLEAALAGPTPKVVQRDEPEPAQGRRETIQKWLEDIRYAKARRKNAFDRMREDMAFTFGKQWPELQMDPETNSQRLAWVFGDRYVMNICQRHVAQRVAALYARNPKPSVKPREKLVATVWDGTPIHAQMAAQKLAIGQQQAMVSGFMPEPDPEAEMVLQEFAASIEQRKQVTRFARTMELLLQHYLGRQAAPFKREMKRAVRRAVTCGVAYIKPGLHQQMELTPDQHAKLNDLSNRLAALERMSAEIADGVAEPDGTTADQLRTAMQSIQQEGEVLVSEGITFEYPRATAIIPSMDCTSLAGFTGASWVAEEFMLTADRVIEIYKVDPRQGESSTFRPTMEYGAGAPPKLRDPERSAKLGEDKADTLYAVYAVHNKADGTCFHVMDGWPDYLREPAPPPILLQQFYPWLVLSFNEVESDEELFPPSDVRLIRSMQIELNRAREGLKEHRKANRPKLATGKSMLSDDDMEELSNPSEDGVAVIQLDGIDEKMKVSDILQKVEMPGIDPNLYDVGPQMDDIHRVVGSQEANLGPASGKATATETAISESSRTSALSSAVDELDETLGDICRAAAQIALSSLSEETVKGIVGPGALWPNLTRDQIADQVDIDIEAGSTGRPNKAAKVADFQSVAPFLIQTPGVRPDKLASYMLTLLDTGMDMADFLDPNLPSIAAMNAMAKGPAAAGGSGAAAGQSSRGDPGADPAQQGPEGQNNAPAPTDAEAGGVPNVPQAGGFGQARAFMPSV